jgi:hypothetical protein
MRAGAFELGEPKHVPTCETCNGAEVGGPYFEAEQSNARLKEHIQRIHGGGSLYVKWATRYESKRPSRPTIRMFGG